jgi:hypothetical protein
VWRSAVRFFSEDDASGLASKVNFKAIAGGSPFNVAVGLRRLGMDSALFAGLSTDYLGRRLLQVLQDEGVHRLPGGLRRADHPGDGRGRCQWLAALQFSWRRLR